MTKDILYKSATPLKPDKGTLDGNKKKEVNFKKVDFLFIYLILYFIWPHLPTFFP